MATPKKLEIVIVPDTPIDDSLISKHTRLTSDGIKQRCLTTAPVLSDLNRDIPWHEKRNKPRLERDDMKVSKRSLAPTVVDLTSETPEKIRREIFSNPDDKFEFKRNHTIEPMKPGNVASFYQNLDADEIKPAKGNGRSKSSEELDNDPLLDMDDEIGQPRRLKRKADVIKPIDVVQIDSDPEVEILEDEQDETVVEVLETMNTLSKSELCNLLNCSFEQAEMIKKQCPILKLEQISSLKEFKLIKKYLDIQRHFQSVNDVISHCERVGGEIRSILDCWAEDSKIDCGFECLKEQPSFVNSKLNLKPYQLVGISWMLMLQEKQLGGILADEMGLGKTAQVVSFLGSLKDSRLPDLRALIVVPSSTLENWMRELDLWCPFLVKASYSGSAKERRMLQYDLLDSDFNVLITTYAIATSQPEDRRFLRKLKCDVLVLDEGHMIKNNSSNRSKHLSGFKIPFKLLITGTPIQNNLLELLNLLTFINPELFNDAFSVFTNIFNNQVESADDLERALVKEKIARASKILQPFILRRKKEDVSRDLPPKTQLVEYIGPSVAQKALVHEIMVRSRKEYMSTKQPDAANNKLHNVVMQLRKAAGHELLFRNLYNEELIKTIAKSLKRVA